MAYNSARRPAVNAGDVIDGDLKVIVPFIGGRVEAEIANALRAAIAVEAETGREYLSRRSQAQ